ncbi:hypothetical protein Lal_00014134 [Lupinus albus]|nr:hypothetical protein Lal_00014134 [Lupinus albus]
MMVMRQMWTFRDDHRPLPYAIIITTILEHYGVSTVGESKILLHARDNKIDVDLIHETRFLREPSNKIYKHQSDQ